MPRPLCENSLTISPSSCSLRMAASIFRNCSCSTAFFVFRTLRRTGKKSVSFVFLLVIADGGGCIVVVVVVIVVAAAADAGGFARF